MTLSALKVGSLLLLLILFYTGLFTSDRITWLMEVTPVIIIIPLLDCHASAIPPDSPSLYPGFLPRHHSDGWWYVHLCKGSGWF
jgi:uncharacterized membrane protein YjdF